MEMLNSYQMSIFNTLICKAVGVAIFFSIDMLESDREREFSNYGFDIYIKLLQMGGFNFICSIKMAY